MKRMVASPSRPARAGSTLTEVLVALLVMAVGVVTLATLFPIAVLRSAQATKLSHAAQLRYNAEAQLAVQPQLLHGAPTWEASRPYTVGEMVVPTLPANRVYFCTNGGTSGPSEPVWQSQIGATVMDGGASWFVLDASNYVVDPLGWNFAALLGDPNFPPEVFGNFGGAPPIPGFAGSPPFRVSGIPNFRPIMRFSGGPALRTLGSGAARAVLPDSFETEYTGIAESNTLTSITLPQSDVPNGIDLNDLQIRLSAPNLTDGVEYRLVMFLGNKRELQVRTHSDWVSINPGSRTITWATPLPAIYAPPASGGLGVGELRLQIRDRRYSWMLSVRKRASGATYASLVIFYRRGEDPEDELIHPTPFGFQRIHPGPDGAPGVAGFDDNNDGNDDDLAELGWLGSDDVVDNNRVDVAFHSAATRTPSIRKGGYVCDYQNNRWYRISDVVNATNLGATLVLEEPIKEDSGPAPAGTGLGFGGALLMQGVVDVYPLRSHLPWEDL